MSQRESYLTYSDRKDANARFYVRVGTLKYLITKPIENQVNNVITLVTWMKAWKSQNHAMKGIVFYVFSFTWLPWNNHIISLNQLNNQLNVHIIMFSFQSSVQCSGLFGGELPRISLSSQLASAVPACGSVGQSTVIDQFSFPWNRGSYPQELPGLYVLAHPHQGKQLIHVLTAKYYEGDSLPSWLQHHLLVNLCLGVSTSDVIAN